MRKNTTISLWFVIIIYITISGCSPQNQQSPESKDTLFQYSTLGSLMAGVYDGEMTFGELKQHGDFGLGTFNTLNGEMIELDGQVYQVKANGVAYAVKDEMKTPFSVVTFFEADKTEKLNEAMDCDQLKAYIDWLLPTENIPYAVKITGKFSYLKTRSVPSQTKPYIPLLKVLETQPTFEFNDVQGTIVGFRLPDYMDIANSPGYHFHFLNSDKNAGGHLLACNPQEIEIQIDYTDQWHTELPADADFYNVDISGEEYQ